MARALDWPERVRDRPEWRMTFLGYCLSVTLMGEAAPVYRLVRGAPDYQARLRRFALVGRTKLRQEGMTDAEIDAAINEAVFALQAANGAR